MRCFPLRRGVPLTDAMLESDSSAVLLSATMVALCGNTAATRLVGCTGSVCSMVAATEGGQVALPRRDFAQRASCRVWTL